MTQPLLPEVHSRSGQKAATALLPKNLQRNLGTVSEKEDGAVHRFSACPLCGLELIALVDPILPVLDSLLRILISLDAFQLHQGDG